MVGLRYLLKSVIVFGRDDRLFQGWVAVYVFLITIWQDMPMKLVVNEGANILLDETVNLLWEETLQKVLFEEVVQKVLVKEVVQPPSKNPFIFQIILGFFTPFFVSFACYVAMPSIFFYYCFLSLRETQEREERKKK